MRLQQYSGHLKKTPLCLKYVYQMFGVCMPRYSQEKITCRIDSHESISAVWGVLISMHVCSMYIRTFSLYRKGFVLIYLGQEIIWNSGSSTITSKLQKTRLGRKIETGMHNGTIGRKERKDKRVGIRHLEPLSDIYGSSEYTLYSGGCCANQTTLYLSQDSLQL